jgi:ribosome maturation factor RimP
VLRQDPDTACRTRRYRSPPGSGTLSHAGFFGFIDASPFNCDHISRRVDVNGRTWRVPKLNRSQLYAGGFWLILQKSHAMNHPKLGLTRKVDPFIGPAFFIGKMPEIEILQAIAERVAAELDCAVVQLTFVREKPGWVLRILVEKNGSDPMIGSGVDLEVCSTISHRVGDIIETDGLIEKAHVLEVSSPGVERPLIRPADFIRFSGRTARFKLREPIQNRKRLQAEILNCDEERVRVLFGKNRAVLEIPYNMIAKANLVFDPSW